MCTMKVRETTTTNSEKEVIPMPCGSKKGGKKKPTKKK